MEETRAQALVMPEDAGGNFASLTITPISM